MKTQDATKRIQAEREDAASTEHVAEGTAVTITAAPTNM